MIPLPSTAFPLVGLAVLGGLLAGPDKATAADFFNGETVYRTYCESCHGPRGQGLIGNAPNFARGQGLMQPDASIYEVIKDGKNSMPAFRGVLTTDEYFDVISYIRSFY